MKTTTPLRIAVLGSGISGIAAANVLQKNGFDVTVFEKSEHIGGVWALAYPNVRLQNIATQYHFSDFPWPFKPDLHPTGTQIREYLEAAVRHFNLDVRRRHEVVSLEEQPEGWVAHLETPLGKEAVSFDFVMISNGQYSDGKNLIRFPGQEIFSGRVMTERDLKTLDEFKNNRVVIAGFGKSAVDMASFAEKNGAASVFHVFRTPRWLLPRDVFGLHFTHLIFNRFGSVMMPAWSHPSGAERFLHQRMPGLIRQFWKMIEGIVRDKINKTTRGLDVNARERIRQVLPTHSVVPDLRSAAALAPEGFFEAVAAGRILPHHAEIEAFTVDGVRLKDGREIACDVAVLSLGSLAPSFPFLPEKYRTKLESEPDGVQLYRHLIHPDVPRVGFAGFNHGFLHIPSVEVGTLWISAWLNGTLELPSETEMKNSIESVRSWKRAHIHFDPSRSCGVNTRFQQHLDTLLLDLGLSPYRKLPNVPAEIFARYGAADYAGVQREFEKKQSRLRKPIKPAAHLH
jgi:cation diffusion facilitator CzcD-associated flavoprotein CzcO